MAQGHHRLLPSSSLSNKKSIDRVITGWRGSYFPGGGYCLITTGKAITIPPEDPFDRHLYCLITTGKAITIPPNDPFDRHLVG
jgi:hypothetical protein